MQKQVTASITISDLKDGELIGFQSEDLIKKTYYYDKNDVDNILDYRLDWRKTDAMFLKVIPDENNIVQLTLPSNSVNFKMRIFWDNDNTSLFVSEPYEKQKTIEFTYTDRNVKDIAIIGEVGLYFTKGLLIDITQFGANVKLKSLGNILSQLNASDKTLSNVGALDVFNSTDLEVLDGYAFASIPLNKLPNNLQTWDTTNVTSFKELLKGRTDWNINLSGFKTPHLNNINGIFNQLTQIPFSINSWDFSNVLVGDSLFEGLNLSNVDLSFLRFTQMLTADYMYQGASNIIGFDMQPINNTSSITTAIGMFKNANLSGVTIDNDFRELVYADSMFENATLTNCNINLTLPKCISSKNMFKNTTLNNCHINITYTKLETVDNGFYSAIFDNTTTLSINFGPSGKASANYLFANSNIKTSNINVMTNTQNILYADYMFLNTIYDIDVSKFILTGAVSANGFIKNNVAFNGNVSSLKFTNCVYLDSAFDGCSSFTGTGLESLLCTSLSDIDYVFRNCVLLNNAGAVKVLNKTVTTMNYAYYGCINVPLTGQVNLPLVEYMDNTFFDCRNSTLDVSLCTFNQVKTMKSAFENNYMFNSNISKFNLSNLEFDGFNRTFANCIIFNQQLPKQNIPKITQFNETFIGCSEFNQPLSIVAEACVYFINVLRDCVKFNSSVEFDLTKCSYAQNVFYGCLLFNQPVNKILIGGTSSADINLEGFFYNCRVFNQEVNTLPFARALSIKQMFYYCSLFNQDLGSLPIKIVQDMSRAFYRCSSVTAANWANAKNWIMTHCTTLEYTFYLCSGFNAAINGWDISSLTILFSAFMGCTTFNQSLASWFVNRILNLNQTFANCTALKNQNFSTWNITVAKSLGQTTNTFFGIGTGNILPSNY